MYNRSSYMNYFVYTLHHFIPDRKKWTQKIDLAPNVWLHSSVGRALHRYRGGHRFKSRWNPDSFQVSSFQLLKLEDKPWWSFFTFTNKLGNLLTCTSEVKIHRRTITPFLPLCSKNKAISLTKKGFTQSPKLECSNKKFLILITKILVAKTEISVTGPVQLLICTSTFSWRKQWWRQISQSKPAQLIRFVWRGPNWPTVT